MSSTIAINLSSDSGNTLAFGTDGGLLCPQPAINQRGGVFSYAIDNSWGTASTPYHYPLSGAGGTTTMNSGLGNCQLWPLMITRDARCVGGTINVTTAAAGSQYYHSVYASDPSTGNPGAKVADLLYFQCATTGVRAATARDTTTVLSAYKLYWMASWYNGAAATVTARTSSFCFPYRAATLTASNFTTTYFGTSDTTANWSSLSNAPATVTLSGSTTSLLPMMWFGFANV